MYLTLSLALIPKSLWIGDIIKNGESVYTDWQKRMQSLTYFFKEEVTKLFEENKFDDVLKVESNRHPILVKKYIQKEVSIETLVILDKILLYKRDYDKKLNDPVWQLISMRIDKYSSFLNLDIFKYRKILKEIILENK